MFKKQLQGLFGVKSIKDIFNVMRYQANLEDPYYYDLVSGLLRKKKAIKSFEQTLFKTMPIYDINSLIEFYDFMKQDKTLVKIIEKVMSPELKDFVFIDEIVVTPPSSRPIITTGSKKDIPDSSKFYKRVLSLTTKSSPKSEKAYP